MTDSSSHTLGATVVESYHTAVAQGELQLTLTLLTGNLTGYRAVYLIGEPVLTCHRLELEYLLYIVCEVVLRVVGIAIVALYGLVHHDGLGRRAEHLVYSQVEGTYAILLLEGKAGIAGSLTHHIHRGTLTLGNLLHMLECLFADEESHALLRLVGNDFFGREGGVTDGQLVHLDESATLLHQLRQAVDMTCRTVVVDGYDRIGVLLAESADDVVGTFLHLGIGTLHGVELDA